MILANTEHLFNYMSCRSPLTNRQTGLGNIGGGYSQVHQNEICVDCVKFSQEIEVCQSVCILIEGGRTNRAGKQNRGMP